MRFVTGVPHNAKTKAASSGRFELDPSSSRPTFLYRLFLCFRRFTYPVPTFAPFWLDPLPAVTVPRKSLSSSLQISVPIQYSRSIPVSRTWHSPFLPNALAAVIKAWICFVVTVRSLWTQHEAWSSLIAILVLPVFHHDLYCTLCPRCAFFLLPFFLFFSSFDFVS